MPQPLVRNDNYIAFEKDIGVLAPPSQLSVGSVLPNRVGEEAIFKSNAGDREISSQLLLGTQILLEIIISIH